MLRNAESCRERGAHLVGGYLQPLLKLVKILACGADPRTQLVERQAQRHSSEAQALPVESGNDHFIPCRLNGVTRLFSSYDRARPRWGHRAQQTRSLAYRCHQ